MKEINFNKIAVVFGVGGFISLLLYPISFLLGGLLPGFIFIGALIELARWFPLLFGAVALVLGIISIKKGNKKKTALVALVLGAVNMVMGINISYEMYKANRLITSPPPYVEYIRRCGREYNDCVFKLREDPMACAPKERICLANFQEQGLIPQPSIDWEGLRWQMTILRKKGVVKKWEISEDEGTLLLWVNPAPDTEHLLSRFFSRKERVRGATISGLFSDYVRNRYSTNACVELRTMDGSKTLTDCDWGRR